MSRFFGAFLLKLFCCLDSIFKLFLSRYYYCFFFFCFALKKLRQKWIWWLRPSHLSLKSDDPKKRNAAILIMFENLFVLRYLSGMYWGRASALWIPLYHEEKSLWFLTLISGWLSATARQIFGQQIGSLVSKMKHVNCSESNY